MQSCEVCIQGKWVLWNASEVDDLPGPGPHQFHCACCKAEAFLVRRRRGNSYFGSRYHAEDCPNATGHRVTVVPVVAAVNYDFERLLLGEDKEVPESSPKTTRAATEFTEEKTEEEMNQIGVEEYELREQNIRSLSGIRRQARELGVNDLIGYYRVGDIFPTPDNLAALAEGSFQGVLAVPLVRMMPSVPVPRDYVMLRIDLATGVDACFLLRCKSDHNNIVFRDRLMGNPAKNIKRDDRKYINVLGNWVRVEGCGFILYRAEVNYAGIDFSSEAISYRMN